MCNTVVISSTASLLLLTILSSYGSVHAIVCTYMNERRNDGDRWVVPPGFIAECDVFPNGSWRVDIVACQTPKGIEMHDGDEIEEDGMKFRCEKLQSGGYRIHKQFIVRNVTCEGHHLGEWWISKSFFNKTCTAKGTRIVNCLADNGIPIELNTFVTLNGTRYNCTVRKDGVVVLTRELSKSSPTRQNYCIVKGIRRKTGETWIEDTNFIKKCNEQAAVTVKACVANGLVINLNSKVEQDGKMYSCMGSSDGNVLFKILPISDNSTLSWFFILLSFTHKTYRLTDKE